MCSSFLYLVISCVVVNTKVASKNIENRVTEYFDSSNVESFNYVWNKYRIPIERSLEQVLKETYGEQGLNVYVRKPWNAFKVSDGFLVPDNVANVLFKDMYLSQFPHLRAPEVWFTLSSSALRVGALVSKLMVEAEYLLFRNASSVVYEQTFDPYKTSPFALPQVTNVGDVTILGEGCYLTGYIVASLSGPSVNLGDDTIRLTNCKFSVEISAPGTGSPPVIAPYFSPSQGKQLEILLLKATRDELLPKLQGAMFTFVNSSALFGNKLSQIRQTQQEVFRRTFLFMTQVVSKMNDMWLRESGGFLHLEDEIIYWKDKYGKEMKESKVTITNVTISGLDSAYSAQTGGPIKMPAITIDDEIRFSALQVRGGIKVNMGKAENDYVFYGEINDVSFQATITLDPTGPSKKANECAFTGWRYLEINAPNLPLIAPNALVNGYLLNKLPAVMAQTMFQHFSKAVQEAENNNEMPNKPDDGDNNDSGNVGNNNNNENLHDSNNEDGNNDDQLEAGTTVTKDDHSNRMIDKPMLTNNNNRGIIGKYPSDNLKEPDLSDDHFDIANQDNRESPNEEKSPEKSEFEDIPKDKLDPGDNSEDEFEHKDQEKTDKDADYQNNAANEGDTVQLNEEKTTKDEQNGRMLKKPMLGALNFYNTEAKANQNNRESPNEEKSPEKSEFEDIPKDKLDPGDNSEDEFEHKDQEKTDKDADYQNNAANEGDTVQLNEEKTTKDEQNGRMLKKPMLGALNFDKTEAKVSKEKYDQLDEGSQNVEENSDKQEENKNNDEDRNNDNENNEDLDHISDGLESGMTVDKINKDKSYDDVEDRDDGISRKDSVEPEANLNENSGRLFKQPMLGSIRGLRGGDKGQGKIARAKDADGPKESGDVSKKRKHSYSSTNKPSQYTRRALSQSPMSDNEIHSE